MTKRNYILGFLKQLSTSVSEIKKKNNNSNYVKYKNGTELPKYIWQLKYLNMRPSISWEIAAVIRCAARIDCCKLCLTGKLFIIKSFDNTQLLNKKSELVDTCRHKNKLSLESLKRNRSKNDTMDYGLTFFLVK